MGLTAIGPLSRRLPPRRRGRWETGGWAARRFRFHFWLVMVTSRARVCSYGAIAVCGSSNLPLEGRLASGTGEAAHL